MKHNRLYGPGNPVPIKSERIAVYSTDRIFDFIKKNPDAEYYVDEHGNRCKLRRAKIYASMGCQCVKCDLKGEFFALEKWPRRKDSGEFHFDLYAVDEDGFEVLMTIDHVHPKSKGGKDDITNYQPMCFAHNFEKGDKV